MADRFTAVRVVSESWTQCWYCDEQIKWGEVAWLVPGVCMWHDDCPDPTVEQLREMQQRARSESEERNL